MGSIWGFHGDGDDVLVRAMQRPMGPRAEVADSTVRAGSWGLATGCTRANGRVRPPAVVESTGGEIHCVFDGYLVNRDEVDELLAGFGAPRRPRNDTDRVVALYAELGTDCFEALDGAYAIALNQGDTLVLARDSLGEKPLYYTDAIPGTLLFGSEVKSFLGHPEFDASP
ncbi:MAG: hypothetical protein QGG40_16970, partial [Myxococcota bacterium]|nr:hypothetical protein [Myxococcota bacterium]